MSSPGFFTRNASLNSAGKWPTASDHLKSATTNGAITSMICLKIDVGIESVAENLSGSRRTALMTSSVASGKKARNATSDRVRRNIGGGEPLVLDCILATFSTKKRLNDSTSMAELAVKRPRPSRTSIDRYTGSDWSDSILPDQNSAHFCRRSSRYGDVVRHRAHRLTRSISSRAWIYL